MGNGNDFIQLSMSHIPLYAECQIQLNNFPSKIIIYFSKLLIELGMVLYDLQSMDLKEFKRWYHSIPVSVENIYHLDPNFFPWAKEIYKRVALTISSPNLLKFIINFLPRSKVSQNLNFATKPYVRSDAS